MWSRLRQLGLDGFVEKPDKPYRSERPIRFEDLTQVITDFDRAIARRGGNSSTSQIPGNLCNLLGVAFEFSHKTSRFRVPQLDKPIVSAGSNLLAV